MKTRFALLALFTGYVGLMPAAKAEDCYRTSRISAEHPAPARSVYLLLDETTVFDENLRKAIVGEALGLIAPGTEFTALKFSAFIQGHYTDVIARDTIESELNKQDKRTQVASRIADFDTCRTAHQIRFRREVQDKVVKALGGATSDIAKSDIMGSLKTVSALAKDSPAKTKTVILASDMLENSSVSSFYQAGSARKVNPAAEMAKASNAGTFGDFGGADVYVIGAGLIPEIPGKKMSGYRDSGTIEALKTFWSEWLEKSNAKLVDFGAPALVGHVK